ncbi:RE1-silencing transcription factor isoform X2 [Nycticebus coucang]|uniref:RE1-silencing transcription factor isoform X2 n=1 Tax=Nycticebus coucang TaxID=9470 RepID=UPI00234C4954|nr:RE1-silencing transcription factor isoform X2 [Nycticebus coucang]
MATQVMGQSSGGAGLFTGNSGISMALPNDMYDLHDLSKAELAAPQLIMLANVALTGEVNGSCCDYLVGEERQMAELMPVGDNNFSDSDGEGLEESSEIKGEHNGLENMELRNLELSVVEPQPVFEASPAPEVYSSNKDLPPETPGAEDKCKNLKTKPFRCKPCQYEAESEEQFVHHIRIHSAKKFFVEESAEKQAKARESGSSTSEEGDFSKGPIRCDRCGYNTNRYDHYTAHLKHHTRAGDNERVYKCIICTYTTVSEYHWRKHLRNHFPRKVYTCGKCNYFSDRKNNYVQHVRTHTGEKPFKCDQCSYVASNQHEVTRHARQVHNGPKPLNCPHCDYKTADRSNFKKHVELHVNPRQFNCPVCDYAASKKCNLQYHFKSKHPTCPNKTMDVSKVKLKKTKKREADLPDNNTTNEKPETEQTKIKGDVAGKKNEKSVKVEKRDVSKEKKPGSSVSMTQVTTRTRKSATEIKEMDVPTGRNSEKFFKSKKSKRKMEAEAESLRDAVNNEEPVTRKKKKVERESRSQEGPKGDTKVEESRKQNACVKKSTKKKTLKNKSSKRSSKPAQKVPAQKGPAQKEPAQMVPAQMGSAQKGTSPMEVVQKEPAQMAPAKMEVVQREPAQKGSAQKEPPQKGPAQKEPAQMVPAQMGSAQKEPAQKGTSPMEVVQKEPAQMAPAQMEVVQKEPAQMAPAQMEVVQKEPAQMAPAQMEVVQKESAQMVPAQMESAQMGPAQIGSAQKSSVQMGPAQMGPPQMEVVQKGPPQMGSAQMEVVQKEPAQKGSVQKSSAQMGSAQTGSQMGSSAQKGPQMEPAQKSSAQMEPTQKGLPQMGSAQMEVVQKEPAQKGSVQKSSAQMGSAQTGSQMGSSAQKGPQMEPAQKSSAQMEPTQKGPPQMGSAQMEVVQKEPAQKSSAQMDPAQMGSAQKGSQMGSSAQKGPQMEPAQKKSSVHMEPAQKGPQMEPAQKSSFQMEPARKSSVQMGSAQVEPAPLEVVQMETTPMGLPPPMDVQKEPAQLGPAPMEVVQKRPRMELPPPIEPPFHMELIPKKSPLRKDKKEKSNVQSEMAETARKELVLIEVGLVPVKDSRLLKESARTQGVSPPSPVLPKESLQEEASKDQKLLSESEGDKEAPLQRAGAEEAGASPAGHAASIEESASVSSSGQNQNMPEGETLDGKYQTDTIPCEMKVDTDQNPTENPPDKDSVVEDPVSPLLPAPPMEESEAVSKTILTSPPIATAVNESQEIDEDEGIHSHDGSDLSDNMSEGSDDSGLHGARPAPQETSRKNAKGALAVKASKGDFVCIFCDRSFRKEKDFSKHLNRHLVNVYYLEKAAQGQE